MPYPNVNAPFGFRPFRRGGQAEVNRVVRQVATTDQNDLRVNDAYMFDGAGNVTRATAATDVVVGIVEAVALAPVPGQGQGGVESQGFIQAGQGGQVIGIEDLDAEFRCQITTVAATDIGVNTQLAVVDQPATPPLYNSQQSAVLDAVGGHDQFRLVELVNSPADNAYGAFAQVVVRVIHAGGRP